MNDYSTDSTDSGNAFSDLLFCILIVLLFAVGSVTPDSEIKVASKSSEGLMQPHPEEVVYFTITPVGEGQFELTYSQMPEQAERSTRCGLHGIKPVHRKVTSSLKSKDGKAPLRLQTVLSVPADLHTESLLKIFGSVSLQIHPHPLHIETQK